MPRDIKLPPHPSWVPRKHREASKAYATAAVEADRKGIVVTDEDVEAAIEAFGSGGLPMEPMRRALESFAARKRGEA